MHIDSLPVRFPEMFQGVVRSEGILRVEHDALVLEYQIKDGLVGVIKSDFKSVTIPFEQISEIELRTNIFRSEIAIRVNSGQKVIDIPSFKEGKVRLRVPYQYRRKAGLMAHELSDRVDRANFGKSDRSLTVQ